MFGLFKKDTGGGEKGISRILGALGAFGLDISSFYPEIIQTIIQEGNKLQTESGARLALIVTLSDDNTQIIAGIYKHTEKGFELYKDIDLSSFENLINGINTPNPAANLTQLEPGTESAGTDTTGTESGTDTGTIN